MNQEEDFKKLIWSHGLKVQDVADGLKISKQTLYNNIRKSPLNKDFKSKWDEYFALLDKKSKSSNNQTALNIGRDSHQVINSNSTNQESRIKELEQKVSHLENTLKDKEMIIELLQGRLRK